MLDGTVRPVERWEARLDRVLLLVRLLGEDARDGLARLGLTESRAHVLWELQHRGPSTQRTLADALKVAPRTITTLIDALVETGFVTREPHPTDRRATLVTFTAHGEQTARELLDGHQRLARDLFEGLPDEMLDGFDGGLDHVIAHLRALVDSTDGR
jgi:DNA-binding MarR family transcriptional regulator